MVSPQILLSVFVLVHFLFLLSLAQFTSASTFSNPSNPPKDRSVTIFYARDHPNYQLLPNTTDCGLSAVPNQRFRRATNGKPAGFGKYLSVARIMARNITDTYGDEYLLCTGSLINQQYVLTSAVCVVKMGPGIILSSIQLGRYDLGYTASECAPYTYSSYYDDKRCHINMERGVEEVIPHEDYNWSNYGNNIALIRMDEPANFTEFIKPVCLPIYKTDSVEFENRAFSVPAWGQLNNYEDDDEIITAGKLYEVNMTILPKDYCDIFGTSRRGKLGPESICGLGRNGMGLCAGDGGAPLIVSEPIEQNVTRQFQLGVFSTSPTRFGISCGRQGVPNIFASVSHYMPWILNNLRA